MSLTRRRFLESASMAALAGAAVSAGFAQTLPGLKDPNQIRSQDLTLLEGISEETFKPFIGESFAVLQANRKLTSLTLISATSLSSTPTGPKAESVASAPKPVGRALKSFAVQFKGLGSPLPQGTYTLQQENLGNLALFLVPAGPGANPQTYTSIFTSFAD